MNYGNVVIRDNGYDVLCDLDVIGSGYNVVSREIDPYNKYDIEDVRRYCNEHPDKVFESYNHEFDEEGTNEA